MSCGDDILDCKFQITELDIQLIFTTLDHSKHNHTKQGLIHSLSNLFGTSSSVNEISAIKYNMEILKKKSRYHKQPNPKKKKKKNFQFH